MAFFAYRESEDWNAPYAILMIAMCFASRAICIAVLCAVANLRRKRKIGGSQQVVLWFAGLRGAIAFSLSIALTTQKGVANGPLYLSTTLIIIIFTNFFCGSLTGYLLRCLRLDQQEEPPHNPAHHRHMKLWSRFENKYLMPLLIYPNHHVASSLQEVVAMQPNTSRRSIADQHPPVGTGENQSGEVEYVRSSISLRRNPESLEVTDAPNMRRASRSAHRRPSSTDNKALDKHDASDKIDVRGDGSSSAGLEMRDIKGPVSDSPARADREPLTPNRAKDEGTGGPSEEE
jgi:hypothetical protein